MAYCSNCGKQLEDGSMFCNGCGVSLDGVSANMTSGGGALQAAAVQAGAFNTAGEFVQDATAEERAIFYRKTYLTAAFSFIAWMGIIYYLFTSGLAYNILNAMGWVSWLVVLGLFALTSFVGSKLTLSESRGAQFTGLAIYIVAYAVIFVPLIAYAAAFAGDFYSAFDRILKPAFIATGAIFAALTATVFLSNKDFSFLRSFVMFGSFAAIGAIIIFTLMGINPGSLFSIAMIVLMSGTILYETHQIKKEARPDQYIGAGAMIFASFMVLMWYVISLFMDND